MTEKDIVLNFWKVMASNDFYAAAELLSPDCEIVWPLTKEVIRGRRNFAQLNSAYPAEGCLLYTSPSPRDRQKSRMPSSA